MRRTLATLAALLVMFASLAGCATTPSDSNKTTLQHDQGGHDWEGGDRWTH
jgi:Spy/CpxP family protein refolding chaperone